MTVPLICPCCHADKWLNSDGEEGWLALQCGGCGAEFKLEFSET
jgi:hypothetical protein